MSGHWEYWKVAARLKAARQSAANGMTQAEAAEVCGLSQSAYSRLENGLTERWSPRARDGAARIIGITRSQIDAALTDSSIADFDQVIAALDKLAGRLDGIEEVLAAAADLDDPPSQRILADLVQRRRGELGVSAMDAALLMGVEIATYVRIERGTAAFEAHAPAVADFLRVDVASVRALIDAEPEAEVAASIDLMQAYLGRRGEALRRWEAGLDAAEAALDQMREATCDAP